MPKARPQALNVPSIACFPCLGRSNAAAKSKLSAEALAGTNCDPSLPSGLEDILPSVLLFVDPSYTMVPSLAILPGPALQPAGLLGPLS